MSDQRESAAMRVHRYLVANHLQGGALIGPDPGVRFNYRIGRFIKGYLPALQWRDDLYYLQGQGYWVLGNLALARQAGRAEYEDLAIAAAAEMLARQRPDGAWVYPNPEWHGRVANAEGSWAAIGLLAAYRRTGQTRFLEGALRWHHFLIECVGFQRTGEQLAVNYFAGWPDDERVPNNSGFVLHMLADLADATGDPGYLGPCRGMLAFMEAVQMPSGEFPYALAGTGGGADRPHYQCFQYNAFQCFDLMRYWELTGEEAALPLIKQGLRFLKTGQAADGHARYDCTDEHRAVTYHAAVLGAAFLKAGQIGLGDYSQEADRAYRYVLGQQREDGSFPHSQGDYRLLGDRRSYPRYLAMILYHLMLSTAAREDSGGATAQRAGEAAGGDTRPGAAVAAAQDGREGTEL